MHRRLAPCVQCGRQRIRDNGVACASCLLIDVCQDVRNSSISVRLVCGLRLRGSLLILILLVGLVSVLQDRVDIHTYTTCTATRVRVSSVVHVLLLLLIILLIMRIGVAS